MQTMSDSVQACLMVVPRAMQQPFHAGRAHWQASHSAARLRHVHSECLREKLSTSLGKFLESLREIVPRWSLGALSWDFEFGAVHFLEPVLQHRAILLEQ